MKQKEWRCLKKEVQLNNNLLRCNYVYGNRPASIRELHIKVERNLEVGQEGVMSSFDINGAPPFLHFILGLS